MPHRAAHSAPQAVLALNTRRTACTGWQHGYGCKVYLTKTASCIAVLLACGTTGNVPPAGTSGASGRRFPCRRHAVSGHRHCGRAPAAPQKSSNHNGLRRLSPGESTAFRPISATRPHPCRSASRQATECQSITKRPVFGDFRSHLFCGCKYRRFAKGVCIVISTIICSVLLHQGHGFLCKGGFRRIDLPSPMFVRFRSTTHIFIVSLHRNQDGRSRQTS